MTANGAWEGPPARAGDPASAIATPALVVALEAMEHNLAAMADWARARGLRLRPHAKMHKCAALARRQIAAGAVGVCVQKPAEAHALAAQGVHDLLLTNEVVDPRKLAGLAALARQVRLGVCVDAALGVERLAEAVRAARSVVDVYVEVDVGQGRCGVPAAAAGALAHRVVSHAPEAPGGPGLRFAGLQAYHGGAQHLRRPEARAQAIAHAASQVRAAVASITAGGIACPLVTGAGSGSFVHEAGSGLWGELQAGSYLFLDADYAQNTPDPGAPDFRHALFVKSQVMSRGAAHAVVDAGHKAHAIDSGLPRVWERPLQFANGGDEHGVLRPGDGAAAADLPALGETVWLVPGHCDPTVNLHTHLVGVRGGLGDGVVEAVWPIDARGALR
ncbi:DSD1 family PLP-dependent enzyme [Piscinibacter sakaiensis]|uniref:Low-specificity D-threonine aldolase n=1 Tax=Piscinibacter sakaiensis TaxID=1547922 RepID=A0A0K8P4P4_PISS1|nr:DSD1 family PLP-dependent enzyme [Piscinibacter sakaiensis]GAP37581.1 low-specificity D-threonine aldolase [Piscinibacter sakaiensis]